MLTASDLRWMEEHRRRAALRRALEAEDRQQSPTGLRRWEAKERSAGTEAGDLCARLRDRPALPQRLGCSR